MKRKLKQLKKINECNRLNERERDELKRQFSAYQDMHPVRDSHASLPGPIGQMFIRLRAGSSYAAVGFAAAVMFTIGASEFSLPNQPLYNVKTGINERVLLASTYFSPTLYAEAGHHVFSRRLEEAEQLMLLDQMRAETADTVQHEIEEHAEALDRSIARAEASGNTESVHTLRTEYAATLAEYEPILDILALREDAPDKAIVDELVEDAVEEHAVALQANPSLETFAAVKADVTHEYAKLLLGELEALNQKIADVVAADGTDTEITPDVAELLETSNALRHDAESLLSNDAETALTYLTQATERAGAALEIIIQHQNDTADEAITE